SPGGSAGAGRSAARPPVTVSQRPQAKRRLDAAEDPTGRQERPVAVHQASRRAAGSETRRHCRGPLRLFGPDDRGPEGRPPARATAIQPVERAVFDGEVVAIGPDGRMSFQRLQNRGGAPDTELHFYVFDLLYLDGYDLLNVALSERKPLLHAVLAPIFGAEEVAAFDDGLSLFGAAQAQGLEGVVAKKRDSIYEPGKRVR